MRPAVDSLLRRKEWYNAVDCGRKNANEFSSLQQDRTTNKSNHEDIKEMV